MMEFELRAKRVDASGSIASAKDANITLDTSITGRPDALNPVELLLASQAACFIKGIERMAPKLDFKFEQVTVRLTASRPEDVAKIDFIHYWIEVATSESQQRCDLLHKNLLKHGTIYNAISPGTQISGTLNPVSSSEARAE